MRLLNELIVPSGVVRRNQYFGRGHLLRYVRFVRLCRVCTSFRASDQFRYRHAIVFRYRRLCRRAFAIIRLKLFRLLRRGFHVQLCRAVQASYPKLSFDAQVNVVRVVVAIIRRVYLREYDTSDLSVLQGGDRGGVRSVSTFRLKLAVGECLQFLRASHLEL